MIEREILKDVKEYKPKFIGPFTLRQTICIGVGGGVAIAAYFGLNLIFIPEFSRIVAGICCVPFLMAGWWEPYDMPLEQFIKEFFVLNVLAPHKRKYDSTNYYETIIPCDALDNEPALTPKELKKLEKARIAEAASIGEEIFR